MAKVTPQQAKKLDALETDVRKRRAGLEEAERKVREQRDRVRNGVALSKDPEERKRGIREAVIGGVSIRITPAMSGETFSLKDYVAAGHKVTQKMRDAIKPGKIYDRWTVKSHS